MSKLLIKNANVILAEKVSKNSAVLVSNGKIAEIYAPKQEIRTAECDWFGAEETLTLSKAAENGLLQQAYNSCLPAEIQIIKIGNWNFVGWQGEIFIEYAFEIKNKIQNTFVISLANGDLQGYIVTQDAFEEGGYEASNALFSHKTGNIYVKETLDLLK